MEESKVFKILKTICGVDLSGDRNINLYKDGFLDSLTTIELLVEIEENFGIVIEPTEVERTDIETPQKIIDLLNKLNDK
jgi:D-alanine--poly(phosphoribitol) ligase subunit 2